MSGLVARELERYYGHWKVVDKVSIEVEAGQVVGLLGPNGAGKTTTFYLIVGLLRSDAGQILVDGKDITRVPMHRRARMGIGYLAQEPSIFRKLTVRENILAILETLPISSRERGSRLTQLLEELNIAPLADRKGYNLSGGERRRVEITRALVTQPKYMLLDEPFVGIDPIAVGEIQDIVRRLKAKGLGVLITDHNVRETLSTTDHAYIMFEGKILLQGTSQELAQDPVARQIYLGERFRLD
ncbi:MAG TPA: LPS export ABC transporter ATP-binding protein [Candidatus Eisenbacteria bacterium]|nr:LPS export ABC transporter ATP-binding protein [Candidatus Eisenbacteria bacterium]